MMKLRTTKISSSPWVEGIDREDMIREVEVVKREHDGVVLAIHWISDGTERHQRTHREWRELTKSGCSKGYTTFASLDSNYLTLRTVEKRIKMG
jgi:hypothetical protein